MSQDSWVVSMPSTETSKVTIDQIRERYGLSRNEEDLVRTTPELLYYAQASTLTTNSSAELIAQLEKTTRLLESLVHRSTGD